MIGRGDLPEPEDLDEEEDTLDEDLWFLPGPDPDEDVPPGATPVLRSADEVLFDPAPWQAAEAALARELAEVAGLFGALDQRLRMVSEGWRRHCQVVGAEAAG